MGFIGYLVEREGEAGDVVRDFLECQENFLMPEHAAERAGEPPAGISYSYAVDVIFPEGEACLSSARGGRDPGIEEVYKLIHSLEERAREHGHNRGKAIESVEALVQHLGYTRNARDFTKLRESAPASKTIGRDSSALSPGARTVG